MINENKIQSQLQIDVKLTDEYLKRGAIRVAAYNQMSLSEYVQALLEKDVSETLGYRVVVTYDTGIKTESTHFYTIQDLEVSLIPFNMLYETGTKTKRGIILAYEVWQHDKLLLSTEQLETVATCPFVVPEGLQTKYIIFKEKLGEER